MKINEIELICKDIDIYKDLAALITPEMKQMFSFRKFNKDTIVSKPGDRGLVYILRSGRVALFEISTTGKKFIYSILKKGRIFGDYDICVPPTFYAQVLEDVELVEIKTKDFMSILMKEPTLLLKLFEYFYVRLLISQKKSVSLATEDVFHRLINLLIQLGKPHESETRGELITDKYTHEQLSDMLGVSRQTITTMISNLQKKEIIKRKKKTFVFNKVKLENATE